MRSVVDRLSTKLPELIDRLRVELGDWWRNDPLDDPAARKLSSADVSQLRLLRLWQLTETESPATEAAGRLRLILEDFAKLESSDRRILANTLPMTRRGVARLRAFAGSEFSALLDAEIGVVDDPSVDQRRAVELIRDVLSSTTAAEAGATSVLGVLNDDAEEDPELQIYEALLEFETWFHYDALTTESGQGKRVELTEQLAAVAATNATLRRLLLDTFFADPSVFDSVPDVGPVTRELLGSR
jgi:hypothetical protein